MAAAQSPPSEYQLKAAFLLNFARYAEWPSLPSGSLKVCLYGRDPFGAALSSLEHRQVQGREVKVVLLGSIEQANTLPVALHLRFRRASIGNPVAQPGGHAGAHGVSDMEGFVDEGAGSVSCWSMTAFASI